MKEKQRVGLMDFLNRRNVFHETDLSKSLIELLAPLELCHCYCVGSLI